MGESIYLTEINANRDNAIKVLYKVFFTSKLLFINLPCPVVQLFTPLLLRAPFLLAASLTSKWTCLGSPSRRPSSRCQPLHPTPPSLFPLPSPCPTSLPRLPPQCGKADVENKGICDGETASLGRDGLRRGVGRGGFSSAEPSLHVPPALSARAVLSLLLCPSLGDAASGSLPPPPAIPSPSLVAAPPAASLPAGRPGVPRNRARGPGRALALRVPWGWHPRR